jgi:fatty acid desaturase
MFVGGIAARRFVRRVRDRNRFVAMLFTLAVILFVLWLLGVVGTYTIGSIVHVLLVIALVLFVFGLLSGRRTVI